jgi:hypothetical protein
LVVLALHQSRLRGAPTKAKPRQRFYNARPSSPDPDTHMAWLQLRISSAHPEFVEEILLGNGAVGVSFIDGEDRPVLEPLPGETPNFKRLIR